MSVQLMLSAGDGPRECRLAVLKLSHRMLSAAERLGLKTEVEQTRLGRLDLPSSLLLRVKGKQAEAFAASWIGTIQWHCQSPFRPKHKRKNWFVSVTRVAAQNGEDPNGIEPDPADLRFETFRAGGPGGQHQNKTDSAVRCIHIPSGIMAVTRAGRSQHQNKAAAIRLVTEKLAVQAEQAAAEHLKQQQKIHKGLKRGGASRVFEGEGFKEV